MSTALAVHHGRFGRAALYQLNKPLATHAHREGHLIFRIAGTPGHMVISDAPQDLNQVAGAAINPWQPHSFVPGDTDEGALFLTLYINPTWFLEVGRSAQGALRFGRCEIRLTEQIERLVRLVTNLLTSEEPSHLFDGYLYELTRSCYEQSWQWTSADTVLRGSWFGVRDFRIRNSMRLMREHMGFTSAAVHPDNMVATMSGGEKQGVAITRALYFDAELVILDEPTMGLSLSETKKTLAFVEGIKKAGKSAIFIDHNIFHVYPVVDRLYVLDRGKVAGVYRKDEISMDELIDRLYRVARTGSLN